MESRFPAAGAGKFAGAASLVLWAAIIVAGRMIAYDWFDCDKPQARIVALAAGCSADQQLAQ